MSSVSSSDSAAASSARDEAANPRAQALADRLMQGAEALASFASSLTDVEWQTRLPKDGRTIGVIVHHVAIAPPCGDRRKQVMQSLRLALVVVTLVSAAACSGYSSPAPSPSPTPSPAGPPSGPSSSVTIPVGASLLGRGAFTPPDVNVAVGTTVTWMNADTVAHTSTSDGNGWNSGIVAPGGQFSFTFPSAGTFSYHCAIHPGMVGTVVVR